jgi:hypothetical protein
MHPNAIEVVDCSAQADCIGDVAGSRFETLRGAEIESLFEGHVLNHVASALPGRHVLEDLGLAIYDTYACWAEDLVSGKDKEIQCLHIDLHMRHRLRSVQKDRRTIPMGYLDHLCCGRNNAESVRDLRDGDQAGLRSEQLLVLIQQHLTAVIYGRDAQLRPLLRAEHLPWDDVGMMLKPGDSNLVVFLNIASSPALGNEIHAFGSAPNEDDLACGRRIQEPANLFTRRFMRIRRTRSQLMRGAMHIGVLVLVEILQPVDDALRLLCGRRVIQPDQRAPVHAFAKYGEVAPDRLRVERIGREV